MPSSTFRAVGKQQKGPTTSQQESAQSAEVAPRRFNPASLGTAAQSSSSNGAVLSLADIQQRYTIQREQRQPLNSEDSNQLSSDANENRLQSSHLKTTAKKRKRKAPSPWKLSFEGDDEEEEPNNLLDSKRKKDLQPSEGALGSYNVPHLRPNILLGSTTTNHLQARSQNEPTVSHGTMSNVAMRDTIVEVNFVFFEGKTLSRGQVSIKLGDKVDVLLDKARKWAARLEEHKAQKSASQASSSMKSFEGQKNWARKRLDDMMLVCSDIIIPHYYDFFYFVANSVKGPKGPLFDVDLSMLSKTLTQSSGAGQTNANTGDHVQVVDKTWYEHNKHIFPASIWEPFDPKKDYQNRVRRDALGNSFFH